MHLTKFTDFSLRVLIFAAIKEPELASIKQVAEAFNVPETHLKKVVHVLSLGGYLDSVRGKGGGFRLAREPAAIKLGEVVRYTESDFKIVECFDEDTNCCRISSACTLKFVLKEAVESFFGVLDRYSLADLIEPKAAVRRLLDFGVEKVEEKVS